MLCVIAELQKVRDLAAAKRPKAPAPGDQLIKADWLQLRNRLYAASAPAPTQRNTG